MSKKISNDFWHTYKMRMNESIEAKMFGITMPAYALIVITLLIIVPLNHSPKDPISIEFKMTTLIIHLVAAAWFVTSYILLINRQMKDK